MKTKLIMTDPYSLENRKLNMEYLKTLPEIEGLTKEEQANAVPDDPNYESVNFFYLVDGLVVAKIKLEHGKVDNTLDLHIGSNPKYDEDKKYSTQALREVCEVIKENLECIDEIRIVNPTKCEREQAKKCGFEFEINNIGVRTYKRQY